MTNLVFDIGNTYIKSAIFDHDEIVWTDHFKTLDVNYFFDLIENHHVKNAIISTVRRDADGWHAVLKEKVLLHYFNADMAAGIRNHYKTPATLGLDRLAAIYGAHRLYPVGENLVIDAGTCITYDYVDGEGNYFGGSISPGLNMRYKALNYYTDSLPLVDANEEFNAPFGNNTLSAIQSGVQNGIRYELTGFIEGYLKNHSELNIILTGGDGIFFDTLLKNSIFAPCIKNEPYLVLKGLNAAIQRDND